MGTSQKHLSLSTKIKCECLEIVSSTSRKILRKLLFQHQTSYSNLQLAELRFFAATAMKILERLGIHTSSSFVKI